MIFNFNQHISRQIGLWFFLLAILPLSISSVYVYYKNKQLIIESSIANLSNLLKEKGDHIELYIEESKQATISLSTHPHVAEAVEHLRIEANRLTPAKKVDYWENTLKSIVDRYGYHDILILDTAGNIIFTASKEKYSRTNLNTGTYRNTELSRVVEKTLRDGTVEISQFNYYEPSKKSASFISAPVFKEKQLIGVVAAQLNQDKLFSIFTTHTGLGKSGELVAGRLIDDGRVVAAGPLRNVPDALESGMVFSEHDPIPILLAVLGKRGSGVAVDYRQKPIIAAWTYLPLLQWGMVLKIDRDEALNPLYRQATVIAAAFILAILLVAVIAAYATSRITTPLRILTHNVKEFGSGNYSPKVQIDTQNEIGLLAKTFNKMADEISEQQISLKQSNKEIQFNLEKLQQANNHLEISEHKNATILERSIEGFWIVDSNGSVIEANQAFCEMLGYERSEVLTLNIRDIEATESNAEMEAHMQRVFAQGYDRFETKHRHKAGHLIDIEISINYEPSLNNIFYCFQRDISRRKATEENLRLQEQIVNTISEGVNLVRGADGIIVFTSKKFDSMFGYSPGELIGKHVSVINCHDNINSEEIANEIMTILIQKGYWQGEIKNVKKDGTVFWCYARVYRFTHSIHGEVMISVHTDITAQKQAIEEQQNLETQLRQAHKMQSLGTLAGGIAHEFNNLLGIILLNAELIMDKYSDAPDTNKQLTRILKSSNQAKKLVSQILSFSRQNVESREPLVFHRVVNDAVSFITTYIPTSILIQHSIQTDNILVKADTDEIHQILINLCTNAAHSISNSGRIDITLDTTTFPDTNLSFISLNPGDYAHLSVSDTGSGMDKATLERACDPFFTTKDVGIGTGMGLALVYKLMRSYDGALHIESAVGKGTTAHLFFPIYETIEQNDRGHKYVNHTRY
ncbi:MAG: PAS domain S-box protein [Gammaproteobacteria bacterium]|nr:PAS domain S-box protein [Gammaproteobacteria bacterium]MDH5799532.1 PAS domain S-box protein [Gammaproteobacteria bacterium]